MNTLWITLVCFLGVLPFARADSSATTADKPWLEVNVGIIGAASEDILKSAIAQVNAQDLSGLIVVLDTPGGSLETTRTMVKEIMSAPFPIIVWVGPAGSRAGSAGAFITLAGHVAAMAPGTNIGASHPVQPNGDDIPSEMGRKVTNDTAAFIESIAKTRQRNVDMARSFVERSTSITADEAVQNNVVDVVAKDVDSLMSLIDGRSVTINNATVSLGTKNAPRIHFEESFRQKLLVLLSNPDLFYLLFLVGLIGLGYEITHPGIMVPGIIGGTCMILALIAMSVLPVSFGAAALILAGVGMMIGEVFVAGFGILGLGGFISFVLGSVFLVDPTNEAGLRVSWSVIAPGAVTIAIAFIALGYLILKAERAPARSGNASLIGAGAVAVEDFKLGQGQIRANGTIWNAHIAPDCATQDIRRGDKFIVTNIDGLELEVRPASPNSTGQ